MVIGVFPLAVRLALLDSNMGPAIDFDQIFLHCTKGPPRAHVQTQIAGRARVMEIPHPIKIFHKAICTILIFLQNILHETDLVKNIVVVIK